MTTHPTSLTTRTSPAKKISSLLALDKITINDIDDLNPAERRHLALRATDLLNRATGIERDELVAKIEQIIPAETKNCLWEYNHALIKNAIDKHMRQYAVMPTKSALAEAAGLSRQTINKHIAEHKQHPEYMAEMEQFKLMGNNVLANVFNAAGKGDMRAARLYFEMIGTLNKNAAGTVVNKQNNYIQINNTILSQESLQQLSAEQLAQIESIVMNSGLKVLL
jgi:hypothetical protein